MATSGRASLTIAQGLGLVALTALGLAALRNPTRLAADLLLDGAVLVTVAAAIVGACGRGRARPFWAGFAIACSGYLLAHFIPTDPAVATSNAYRSSPTRLLDSCFETLPKPAITNFFSPPDGAIMTVVTRPNGEQVKIHGEKRNPAEQAIIDEYQNQIDLSSYRRLGHAVFSLIAGTAGGMLALAVAPKAPPHRPEPTDPTPFADAPSQARS